MKFDELTALLDRMPEYNIPAADCKIFYHRKPIYRHIVGYSDIENRVPVSEDTLYNLYSATKVATSAAAMILYDRGVFGFDDEVAEYLPEFSEMYIRDEKSGEITKATKKMTVRHLLTMTGGLTYDLNTEYLNKLRENHGDSATTRDAIGAIAKSPLIFEPGTHYRYSLCIDVIGALIEVWSGMSFGSFLKQNIFDPVGMKDTGFIRDDKVCERMAYQYVNYDHKTGKYTAKHKKNGYCFGKYESGGAGLVSSVDDYAAFTEMMAAGGVTMSGERIIKRETLDIMRSNQLAPQPKIDFDTTINRAGYSYGFGVRTLIDGTKSPSPVGEYGWDGAMGAYLLIDPENELAIFYAQHEAGAAWYHEEIRNAAYHGLKSL